VLTAFVITPYEFHIRRNGNWTNPPSQMQVE
jgi:hypothetical protein